MLSNYYNKAAMAAAVERGDHREVIGGRWDEIGELQLAFLQANGLTADSTLLDIGCGSLRLGARAVEYLNAAKYWGTDLNAVLLDAGYEKEIVPAGLSERLPRSHLIADEEFRFSGIPANIDFAIATSVFTHLPLNHMRLCLANLAERVTSGCTFYFTLFTPPEGMPVTGTYDQAKGGKRTYPHRDPYHYSVADLDHAAAETPWTVTYIGEWGHPRNQMMAKAEKPETLR